MSENNKIRGQPKKFESGEQLIDLWIAFNEDIRAKGYKTVPTQSNFCKYLSKRFKECDRRTIYNSLNEYFPTVKKEFESIQADTIAEGGMLGHYQSTMSIFALKNWCKWTDRPTEAEHDVGMDIEDDPLTASLKELARELDQC